MKSDSGESSSPSRPPAEPSTPDTAPVAESATASSSVKGSDETTSTLTVQSSPSSSDGDSIKKGKKGKGKHKDGEEAEKGSNLIGKITNLISTDLQNIIGGRDFPMLLVSLPLQIVLCIIFLYKLLGWSAVVGMVVMLVLYPLPGWVVSKMQGVQREKMKVVSPPSPFTHMTVSFWFCYRRMRAFRL